MTDTNTFKAGIEGAAPLPAPATDGEAEKLAERLMSEGAIAFCGEDAFENGEDDREGAVIPIPVKLRDDLVSRLRSQERKDG